MLIFNNPLAPFFSGSRVPILFTNCHCHTHTHFTTDKSNSPLSDTYNIRCTLNTSSINLHTVRSPKPPNPFHSLILLSLLSCKIFYVAFLPPYGICC
ncbi:hypothetical protein RJT34_06685 [Clitoria ternatea]|uniref:Uncharacterized protein n=1 Tax=Clitoria ternatea TaxID=43366 RepID=A0AAN9PT67_CLITE